LKLLTIAGALVGFAVLASGVAGADRGKSIFDEDWTPPAGTGVETRRVRGAGQAGESPSSSSEVPTGAGSKAAGEKSQSRVAVPGKAAQAAVRRVMKEVFAGQLADRSVEGRRKLTAALLEQAEKSGGAPVDRFVLLAAAVDAAVDGVDLRSAAYAADRMAAGFEVDALGVKADAALRVGPRSNGAGVAAESAADNVRTAVEISVELARAEDFVNAARVCSALQPATANNPALRARLQTRIREVGLAREASDRFGRDLAKLKAAPNDPALNLSVGRYACFVQGAWDEGLAMLAKGSDPVLKRLAAEELARPAGAEDVVRVGDGWWDLAAKQNDAATRAAVRAHAAVLYSGAIDGLNGLRKVQVEQRLAEAREASAGGDEQWTDLLKRADVGGGVVRGTWTMADGELRVARGAAPAQIRVPVRPAGDYRVQVEVARPAGGDAFAVYLPVGEQGVMLVLKPTQIGLDMVDGRRFDVNETARGGAFGDAGKHVLDVGVTRVARDVRIAVRVDGKASFEWTGPPAQLSVRSDWAMPSPLTLGFGSWDTAFVISGARVKEGGR
jgi:hypothetical protein